MPLFTFRKNGKTEEVGVSRNVRIRVDHGDILTTFADSPAAADKLRQREFARARVSTAESDDRGQVFFLNGPTDVVGTPVLGIGFMRNALPMLRAINTRKIAMADAAPMPKRRRQS